ncbi:MAG: hypothetical protein H6707_04065 [Deltaproteobacteria bacterium]|nr:hypothetical protein [Deltaproteobacteria bacterium]
MKKALLPTNVLTSLVVSAAACRTATDQCLVDGKHAQCVKACEDGHAQSCLRASKSRDDSKSLPFVKRACSGGIAAGCQEAARLCSRAMKTEKPAAVEQCEQHYHQRACALGDHETCEYLKWRKTKLPSLLKAHKARSPLPPHVVR